MYQFWIRYKSPSMDEWRFRPWMFWFNFAFWYEALILAALYYQFPMWETGIPLIISSIGFLLLNTAAQIERYPAIWRKLCDSVYYWHIGDIDERISS